MTATAPIALELIEDAIHGWVASATGIPADRVCFVEPRDSGAPDVALPAALIQMIAGPIPIGQPEVRKIASIVQQRITVGASGPGSFGVNLYVAYSDTASSITYVSGIAESPATVAAALLVELTANLPAGITAAADPEDTASLIVTGSSSVPLFALAPTNANVTITPLRERFPELECEWSRLTWRVTFRAEVLRGFGTATDLMARARKDLRRVFSPVIQAAGWKYFGTLAAQPFDPPTRDESQATLDFALEGYCTAAYQRPAMRLQGEAEFAFQ